MLIKKTKIPFFSMVTIGMLPSFFKKIFYRFLGYRIGKKVKIGFGSIIVGEKVSIDNNVSIGFGSVIRARNIILNNFVSIGSFTMIDSESIHISEDARINEKVIIGGMKTPESSLFLGKRVIIMEYSFINTTMPIKIGDDSGVGGHCLLFTHGSWLNQLEGYPVNFSSIIIGKNVWLPWRVFIMPGTKIGDNVVVGANSLVSGEIDSNSLIAGSPAKVIKNNYPNPISNNKRKEYITNIFLEFKKYLIYNNFIVNEIFNDVLFFEIIKNNKSYFIYYINKPVELVSKNKNNSLFVFDCEYNKINLYKKCMSIDLKNKIRIGSNDVGEEFVKFLSRYGIRLNREKK